LSFLPTSMWHGHPARVSNGRPRPCFNDAPASRTTLTSQFDIPCSIFDIHRCHPERSASISSRHPERRTNTSSCHPERSKAEEPALSLVEWVERSANENRKSAIENRKSSNENRKSAIENRKSANENRKSAIENRKSANENRKSANENRKSSIENRKLLRLPIFYEKIFFSFEIRQKSVMILSIRFTAIRDEDS